MFKNSKTAHRHIKTFFILSFLLIFLFSCNQSSETTNSAETNADSTNNSTGTNKPIISRDLKEIKESGKLKALMTYSNTSYFLYRGQPKGFEYEILKRFADHLGVELDITLSRDLDSMFYLLNNGTVDVVAHGLTITSERAEQADFTDYLYLTHQVLVQKKPDNWREMKWSSLQKHLVHDAIELIGDTVSIRKNSSYYHRIKNLSDEIGGEIIIDTLPGELSTDEIIKMVLDGEIKYTIADNNIASINKSYYPQLNIEVPISFSQRIAWPMRKSSPELLKAANNWLKTMKKEVDYYVIYNRYFKNKRKFRKRIQSDLYSLNKNQISPYDDLIKKYAKTINWDWRLLASLIYQESRFKPENTSWASAKGLMQLMPETAKELGVKKRGDPEQSIWGGTKYLQQIWERFEEVKDSTERIKFTMAAFNCGYNHVEDAQRLAKKNDLDPHIWNNNVEKMIMKLSYPQYYNDPVVKFGYVRGIEPKTYVAQIFERFEHYKRLINS